MKKLLLIVFLIVTSLVFSMNKKESDATKELCNLFTEYKKQEPELEQEYDKAVSEQQRTPSPANERRLEEAQEKIDSPRLEIKKRLRPPLSEHLDLSKIDITTMRLIAPNIVKE